MTNDFRVLQEAMLAAYPAGTGAGDALRRFLESGNALARLSASITGGPNDALTAPQLEAFRVATREIRRARAVFAEYGLNLGADVELKCHRCSYASAAR